MVNIDMLSNYKPVRKTVYDIHVCKPPTGTIVINKLEQADVVKTLRRDYFTVGDLQVMQQRNPNMFGYIQKLKAAGRVYEVKDSDVVLAGTCGEMWTVSVSKLASTYSFLQDGQRVAITPQIIKSRCLNNNFLPWTVVRTRSDTNVVFACFVPVAQKGTIPTPWGVVLNYNDPNAKHGKGDFIIAQNLNGQPNIGDRYVVNGEIFARTYTPMNRDSFSGCLVDVSRSPSVTIDRLPVLVSANMGDGQCENPELFAYVENLLNRLVTMQHASLPMHVEKSKEDPNELTISTKAIAIMNEKMSDNQFKSERIFSVVRVCKGNVIGVKIRSQNSKGSVRNQINYSYNIPFNKKLSDTVDIREVESWLDTHYDIAFGLCGFVKEVGIQNSVVISPMWTKFEQDGLRDYTMTSDVMHAICRGYNQEDKERYVGTLRAIEGCDSLFDKARTVRPLRVFRGQVVRKNGFTYPKDFDNPFGIAVNTSYNSTTFNMSAASFFAACTRDSNGNLVGNQQGIIHVIDIPVGTKAIYFHNLAGWVEQFEFALDRSYDLNVEEVLFRFRDGFSNEYKVVRSTLVPHTPYGNVDPIQSASLIKEGKTTYDANGRVSVQNDLNKSVLYEAYDILKRRGFQNVQFNDGLTYVDHVDSSGNVVYKNGKAVQDFGQAYGYTGNFISNVAMNPSIIVRSRNEDKGKFDDYSFELDINDSLFLNVKKISVSKNMRGDFGSDAKEQIWSEYGLGRYIVDKQNYLNAKINSESDLNKRAELIQTRDEHFDAVSTFLAEYKDSDAVSSIQLSSVEPDEIAKKIFRYVKSHENLCLLPLLDVARYFDLNFAQTVIQEGYELKNSIRVERVVDQSKESDPQAGYVPCKYTITGDNDDNLVIMVKFSRDKATKKLIFEYRGRSENTAVKDDKVLNFSVFNAGVMSRICHNILSTFAKKMHLSKARRIDTLMEYYARNTGCDLVYHRPVEKDKLTSYTIWGHSHKSKMVVSVAKEDVEKFNLYIKRDEEQLGVLSLDTTRSIFELYHDLVGFLISR